MKLLQLSTDLYYFYICEYYLKFEEDCDRRQHPRRCNFSTYLVANKILFKKPDDVVLLIKGSFLSTISETFIAIIYEEIYYFVWMVLHWNFQKFLRNGMVFHLYVQKIITMSGIWSFAYFLPMWKLNYCIESLDSSSRLMNEKRSERLLTKTRLVLISEVLWLLCTATYMTGIFRKLSDGLQLKLVSRKFWHLSSRNGRHIFGVLPWELSKVQDENVFE